ncbi:hypothetical protein LTS15_009442 [Exophiala xenobiotica]|nr:hypothetical protein LTS15_009442 [Exophiala xenobiotica]
MGFVRVTVFVCDYCNALMKPGMLACMDCGMPFNGLTQNNGTTSVVTRKEKSGPKKKVQEKEELSSEEDSSEHSSEESLSSESEKRLRLRLTRKEKQREKKKEKEKEKMKKMKKKKSAKRPKKYDTSSDDTASSDEEEEKLMKQSMKKSKKKSKNNENFSEDDTASSGEEEKPMKKSKNKSTKKSEKEETSSEADTVSLSEEEKLKKLWKTLKKAKEDGTISSSEGKKLLEKFVKKLTKKMVEENASLEDVPATLSEEKQKKHKQSAGESVPDLRQKEDELYEWVRRWVLHDYGLAETPGAATQREPLVPAGYGQQNHFLPLPETPQPSSSLEVALRETFTDSVDPGIPVLPIPPCGPRNRHAWPQDWTPLGQISIGTWRTKVWPCVCPICGDSHPYDLHNIAWQYLEVFRNKGSGQTSEQCSRCKRHCHGAEVCGYGEWCDALANTLIPEKYSQFARPWPRGAILVPLPRGYYNPSVWDIVPVPLTPLPPSLSGGLSDGLLDRGTGIRRSIQFLIKQVKRKGRPKFVPPHLLPWNPWVDPVSEGQASETDT